MKLSDTIGLLLKAKEVSDLAEANGAILATLDENIPGSYLIPK